MTDFILGVILTFLILFIIFLEIRKFYKEEELRLKTRLQEKELEYNLSLQEFQDKSRSTIRGNVTQEIVSLLPGFPYEASDCKFMGQPYDYIVFKNMSSVRDSKSVDDIEIIFVDVKKNSGRLTRIQSRIKKAIENKQVRFETWHVDENNKLEIK